MKTVVIMSWLVILTVAGAVGLLIFEPQLAAMNENIDAITKTSRSNINAPELPSRLDALAAKMPEPYDDSALSAKIDALAAKMPEPYDDSALSAKIDALAAKMPEPYDDSALSAKIDALAAKMPATYDDKWLRKEMSALKKMIALIPEQDKKETLQIESVELNLVGTVLFKINEYKINSNQESQIDTLIRGIDFGEREFVLQGHTDRTGNDLYNIGLSNLRSAEVRARILKLSQGRARFLSVDGFGEIGTPIPTPDEIPKLENRAVRIFVTTNPDTM